MKKAVVLAVGGILVALVVAYSVEAKLTGQWWKRPGVVTKLKLKEEQVETLDQEAFDYRTKAIKLKAQLKQKKNEVRYLLEQEPVDRKAVIKASVAAAAVQNDILANRIDAKLARREILSDLQQEKVEEMIHRRARKDDKEKSGKKTHHKRGRPGKLFKGDVARTWWENPEVAAEVGLNDEQIKGLRDSAYTVGQKVIELRAQKEIKELTLKRAIDVPEVERKTVDGLVGEIGEIEKKLAENKAELMVDEREILTSEQIDKLKTTKIEEAKERREFRRERYLGRAGREKQASARADRSEGKG